MTVAFDLGGQPFTALNGGPHFKFNEAVSFQILCDTQSEIDYFWSRLPDGGRESQCGWLKDRYGLSWQVVPAIMSELMSDHTSAGFERTMTAMLQMRKLDIEKLKKAYAGG